MTTEDLKLIRLANQHLLAPADVHTVVRDLCGVQAQFLSNAFHALRTRSNGFNEENLSGFVKSWTLRGTMHLFDEKDLPLMLHQNRTRFLRPCDTFAEDEYITAERKRLFADLIKKSVTEGIGEREALKQLCFDAGMTETEAQSVFNPWGGLIRALCETGMIMHTVSEKKAFAPCPAFVPMDKNAAELELALRYFTHYGPATVRDAAYFFGCTQAEVKRWIDTAHTTTAAIIPETITANGSFIAPPTISPGFWTGGANPCRSLMENAANTAIKVTAFFLDMANLHPIRYNTSFQSFSQTTPNTTGIASADKRKSNTFAAAIGPSDCKTLGAGIT